MTSETCPKVTVFVIDSIILIDAILMIVSITRQKEYIVPYAYFGILGVLALAMILGILGAAIRIGMCLLISNILQWLFMLLEVASVAYIIFFASIIELKSVKSDDDLWPLLLMIIVVYYGSLLVLMIISTIFQCKLRAIIVSLRAHADEPFSYNRGYLMAQNI